MENASSGFTSEFERLFEESNRKYHPGRIVSGKVININKDMVTVDIGFKSEGVIPVDQFPVVEGKLDVKIGDTFDVFIIALENEYGQVLLSKEKADQRKVWMQVEDLQKKGGSIKGLVTGKVKGGLQVDIGIPAFLPGSQVDLRPHRNLDKFLNQEFEFKVLKITRDKGNIVLSRRALLVSERDQLRTETLKVLQEGVVMEGVVKNLTEYGAFIDLGGIDGLLHISDISWGRVTHPSEKLQVGQTIPVVVLRYDEGKERVSLGMKQLNPDPWLSASERYPLGGRVSGKAVESTPDGGVILELEEGIDGIVSNNDLSWTKKSRNVSKMVSDRETVEAVILGIDDENHRVKLGVKQLMPNPWEDLIRNHPRNSKVKGPIRSITDFGIFLGVSEGIDGLVHVSDFSWTKRITDPKEIHEMFKKGDEVEAVVLDIDIDNERLSLGIKQLTEDPWISIVSRYPRGRRIKGKITSIADFGVFMEVEPEIEGLIHTSELELDKGEAPAAKFAPGQEIEAEVLKVDQQARKISLSMRAAKRRAEEKGQGDYIEDNSGAVTFGDLIRQKMGGD